MLYRSEPTSFLRWLGPASSGTPFFEETVRGARSCIEARVALNEPGQSNGVFRLWVDGALEARQIGSAPTQAEESPVP